VGALGSSMSRFYNINMDFKEIGWDIVNWILLA
jgi:hypothetical protein